MAMDVGYFVTSIGRVQRRAAWRGAGRTRDVAFVPLSKLLLELLQLFGRPSLYVFSHLLLQERQAPLCAADQHASRWRVSAQTGGRKRHHLIARPGFDLVAR